ncbi:MAG: alanine--tRNA ligase [bacterium]
MLSSDQIRSKFLEFFKGRGHEVVPSSSLVPANDPSLLFTSAGMVQFKNMFLGKTKLEFTRAASSQKCFRTNDIERVGYTSRHQTFFEMLGNFSFGDYFKKEAIEWAWEFLTKDMGLAEEKLYASIYKDDDESFEIWRKILATERIVRLGEENNFWNMGETGPCGPCSEILYDMGKEYGCGKKGCGPGCDCDRYVEIWNLVFTQFNRTQEGKLVPLPQKNIDTGMGLERLCVITQNVNNNFETDLLKPIIEFTAELSDTVYAIDEKKDTALKVIADHTRGIIFLIADGVLPSNEGRGYVLRRILRRAVRHGSVLGLNEPFLFKVTGKAVEIMKKTYPQLKESRQEISQVTLMEEERFQQTLEAGTKMLDELIGELKGKGETVITGESAFALYDTYGFPLDLTIEIAREHGLSVDEEGFNTAMEDQKTQSRQSWKGSGERDMGLYEEIHKETGDTTFRGYKMDRLTSRIQKIIKGSQVVDEASKGEIVEIILSETPFYGESGGQIGDTGKILKHGESKDDTAEFIVTDSKKPLEGLIIHMGEIKQGKLKVGDDIEAIIDSERRRDIARSHTTTHILHRVLREVLGEHVKQAGSLVEAGNFRFDFNHMKGLSERDRDRIETLVNEAIRKNFSVLTCVTTFKEAKNIGAMALFGEKYTEKVRMVMITSEGLSAPADAFSMELCGGTHLAATGEIGLFKLTGESSIAAGVRRIEGLVGNSAYELTKKHAESLNELAGLLKTSPEDSSERLARLIKHNKELEKEISKIRGNMAKDQTDDLLNDVIEQDGIKIISKQIPSLDRDALRTLGDNIKAKLKSGVIVLASPSGKSAALLGMVTDDLVKKGFNAGKIIKEVATIAGGSGGGRADFAQAGIKDGSKLGDALKAVPEVVKALSK